MPAPTNKLGLIGWLRAFWLMYTDKRTPLLGKIGLTALAALYLLSPIDLVPELLTGPLGLLDDMILVPLLLWLVTRLTPRSVREAIYARVGRMKTETWDESGEVE